MKNTQLLTAALSLPLILLSSSCSSLDGLRDSGPDEVDAGLLQYADESASDSVREARLEVVEAEDSLRAVQLKLKDAREMRSLAMERAEVADERLELAESREERADRSKIVNASAEVAEERQQDLRRAKNRVDVYDRMIEAREQELDLAEAKVDHAQAKVQLRLAQAVSGLQRKDVEGIDVAEYEMEVREQQTEVDIARTRFQASLRELKVSRDAFQGDATLFPEMETEFDSLLSELDS